MLQIEGGFAMKSDEVKINNLGNKYMERMERKLSVVFGEANVSCQGTEISIWIHDPETLRTEFIMFNKDDLYSQVKLERRSEGLTSDDLAFIWNIIRRDVAKYYTRCINPILKQKETYNESNKKKTL